MATRRLHPRRHRPGFTLVELLLVLSIMVIAAGVIAPRYAQSVQRYRADLAAQRIARDLEYVAASARAQSRPRTIVFDIPGTAYSAPGLSSPDRRQSTNYTVALAADPYKAALISASFGGSATLSVDAFGNPAADGTVVITVGSEARAIDFSAASGKATFRRVTL